MIFGTLTVDPEQGAVHTNRDSYLLDTLTAVSVRRPLLPGCLMIGAGLCGFGLAFGDLLHLGEMTVLAAAVAVLAGIGLWLGRLSLISRDLRGSEFASAIWGHYAALQRIRAEIVAAIVTSRRT